MMRGNRRAEKKTAVTASNSMTIPNIVMTEVTPLSNKAATGTAIARAKTRKAMGNPRLMVMCRSISSSSKCPTGIKGSAWFGGLGNITG